MHRVATLLYACALAAALVVGGAAGAAQAFADGAFIEAEPRDTASHLIANLHGALGQSDEGAGAASIDMPPSGSIGLVDEGYMPTTGDVRALVLRVQFPDCPLEWDGGIEDAYDGASSYLAQQSYGRLNVSFDVADGIYTAQHERAYYETVGVGATLADEVVRYFDASVDYAAYDADGNGCIDALHIHYAGDNTGYASTWWAYIGGSDLVLDGTALSLHTFIGGQKGREASTIAHEMGHLMGLGDYYDTSMGHGGYYGDESLMYTGSGDLDPLSKLLLGWVEIGQAVTADAEVYLRPFETTGDLAVVYPGGDQASEQFFIVAAVASSEDGSGVKVWRANVALDSTGTRFKYENGTTGIPLVGLVYRSDSSFDGVGMNAGGAAPILRAGQSYTPYSYPSTFIYDLDQEGATYLGPYVSTGISIAAQSCSASGSTVRVSYEQGDSATMDFSYVFECDAASTLFAAFEFPRETYVAGATRSPSVLTPLELVGPDGAVDVYGYVSDLNGTSGRRLILYTMEPLVQGATYTLTVPAGVMVDAAGASNPELVFAITADQGGFWQQIVGADLQARGPSTLVAYDDERLAYFYYTDDGLWMAVMEQDGTSASQLVCGPEETDWDYRFDVRRLDDGSFLVGVRTTNHTRFYHVGHDGTCLLTVTFGPQEYCEQIIDVADGAFLISRYADTVSWAWEFAWIDLQTGELVPVDFEVPLDGSATSGLTALRDGGYVLLRNASGDAYNLNKGDYQVVERYDADFRLVASYGGPDAAFAPYEQLCAAGELADGGIFVLSLVNPYAYAGKTLTLTLFDADLNVLERRAVAAGTALVGDNPKLYELQDGYAIVTTVGSIPTEDTLQIEGAAYAFEASVGRVYVLDADLNVVLSEVVHCVREGMTCGVDIDGVVEMGGSLYLGGWALFRISDFRDSADQQPWVKLSASQLTLKLGEKYALTAQTSMDAAEASATVAGAPASIAGTADASVSAASVVDVSDGNDGNGLTWFSSDEDVATVSDGVVEARGVGTAAVTAMLPGGASASCLVTVESVTFADAHVVLEEWGADLPATPAVTVTLGGAVLEPNVDYRVEYAFNECPGTGHAVILGLGSYEGQRLVEDFEIGGDAYVLYIEGGDFDRTTVLRELSAERIAHIEYSKTAEGELWVGDVPLYVVSSVPRDGTVVYRSSYNISWSYDASARKLLGTITPDELTDPQQCTGAYTLAIPIPGDDKNISRAEVEVLGGPFVFKGEALEPQVEVVLDGIELVNWTDYGVSYEGNAGVGTARVVVTGMGDYVGSAYATFRIIEAPEPEPTPDPEPTPVFSDTPADAWYVEGGYIAYVVAHGLMTGYDDAYGNPTGFFGPEDCLTRAQVATILYRYATAGTPVEAGASPFFDVDPGAWYGPAVLWCYSRGVVTGYTDGAGNPTGLFGPNDFVTREQLATMVHRFASLYGAGEGGSDISGFPDAWAVSGYAAGPLSWCFSQGIITGSIAPDGTAWLIPGGLATRCQMAKIATVLTRDVLSGAGALPAAFEPVAAEPEAPEPEMPELEVEISESEISEPESEVPGVPEGPKVPIESEAPEVVVSGEAEVEENAVPDASESVVDEPASDSAKLESDDAEIEVGEPTVVEFEAAVPEADGEVETEDAKEVVESEGTALL